MPSQAFKIAAFQAEQIALQRGGQHPGSLVNISGIHTQNPKQYSEVIRENIIQILGLNKTLNFLFHPSFYLDFLVLTLSIALIIKKNMFSDNFALILFPYILYSIIGHRLKQYTSFDTARANMLESIANYLILSFLTFLIFGSLLTFFRKNLIGF